jgi:hypothetical protein
MSRDRVIDFKARDEPIVKPYLTTTNNKKSGCVNFIIILTCYDYAFCVNAVFSTDVKIEKKILKEN